MAFLGSKQIFYFIILNSDHQGLSLDQKEQFCSPHPLIKCLTTSIVDSLPNVFKRPRTNGNF